MNARATGQRITQDGEDRVVFERTFNAPEDKVWAAVTESKRLARWIGTWTGDPASGSVQFQMNAEGDDTAESTYEIQRCEPPTRLDLRTEYDRRVWQLRLELSQTAQHTTLTFSQMNVDPAMLESIGPGWDYYLDRLVAAESGENPDAIEFEPDYYPGLAGYYLALVAPGRSVGATDRRPSD